MSIQSFLRAALALSLLLLAAVASGQPVPIAHGLLAPIGIAADASGHVWVAERGTGNDDGQISVIEPDGTVSPFLVDVPSTVGAEDIEGLSHIALAGDDVWFTWADEAVLEGTLSRISRAGWSPGDTPKTLADLDLEIDVATYSLANGAASSNPYGIAPAPDGTIYLTDAGANTLLHYDPVSDAILTVAFFPNVANPSPIGPPTTNAVPTGVAWADGRLYLSTLTGFPFNDHQARVIGVETDGVAYDAASGHTLLTDVARDPRDGALAALRFAVFRFAPPPPGFVFGTGLAAHLGDGHALADDLPLATGLAYGPDGALYISTIIGTVFRLDAPPAALDTDLLSGHRIDAPVDTDSPLVAELRVTNTTGAAMDVDVWAVAHVAGTDRHIVVNTGRSGMLSAGETGRVRLRQRIKPADGDRTVVYTIYAGDSSAGDPASGDGAVAHEQIVIRQEGLALASAKTSGPPLADGGAEWDEASVAPEALAVGPNPARGRASVAFALEAASDVRLTLHDALGREVAVLASGRLDAGSHRAEADLSPLAPGVYIVRLATSAGVATQRLTAVR